MSYVMIFALGKAQGRSFSRSVLRRFWAVWSTDAFVPHVLSMNFPAFLLSIFAPRSEMTRLNQKQCLEGLDALIIPLRISSSVTGEKQNIEVTSAHKDMTIQLSLECL